MTTVTLRKVGNSLALTIPAETVIRERLEAGQAFTLVETGDGFRLLRGDEKLQKQLKVVEEVMKTEEGVLALLARA